MRFRLLEYFKVVKFCCTYLNAFWKIPTLPSFCWTQKRQFPQAQVKQGLIFLIAPTCPPQPIFIVYLLLKESDQACSLVYSSLNNHLSFRKALSSSFIKVYWRELQEVCIQELALVFPHGTQLAKSKIKEPTGNLELMESKFLEGSKNLIIPMEIIFLLNQRWSLKSQKLRKTTQEIRLVKRRGNEGSPQTKKSPWT